MKSLLLLLLSALAAPALHADDDTTYTVRRFEGSIGDNLPVSLFLTRLDSDEEAEYSGFYYYHRRGAPISLEMSDKRDGGKLVLREPAPYNPAKPDAPETFTGTWMLDSGEGEKLNGVWKSGDGKRTLPVSLKEAYPDGSFRFRLVHLSRDHHQKINGKKGGEERSLSFPQIDGDTPAARRINASIRQAVLGAILPEDREKKQKAPKTPDVAAITKLFFDLPATNDSLLEDEFPHVYDDNHHWTVVMNSDGILALEYLWDDYTGGAHGNYGFGFHVFNAATGEAIDLAGITVAGYQKRWVALGGSLLRKQQGLPADAPLSDAGLFEDSFELNDSWCVLPDGIQFSYDPYEIGPYARGQIAFTLPWKDILPDLKPGTPIHAYAVKRSAK